MYWIHCTWYYVLRRWPVDHHHLFWKLTIAEFNAVSEGIRQRKRDELEQSAHLAAYIINNIPFRGKKGHAPKAVTAENIIGKTDEELKKLKYQAAKVRVQNRQKQEQAKKERPR